MSEADALEDWSDEGCYDDYLGCDDMDTIKTVNVSSRNHKPRAKPKGDIAIQRGVKVKMLCNCGNEYKTRKADLLRGWGLSCSKSCAAKRREFNLPSAKILGEVL